MRPAGTKLPRKNKHLFLFSAQERKVGDARRALIRQAETAVVQDSFAHDLMEAMPAIDMPLAEKA